MRNNEDWKLAQIYAVRKSKFFDETDEENDQNTEVSTQNSEDDLNK